MENKIRQARKLFQMLENNYNNDNIETKIRNFLLTEKLKVTKELLSNR